MLQGRRVLVVEDEAVTALDVGDAVEAAGGTVIGPTPSTRGALRLLNDTTDGVDAAAIDFGLADGEATPLVEALMHADIPTVIYTGGSIPDELAARFPRLAVVRKPSEASAVTAALGAALERRA
jgi:DNA-binding NtrC family response regulator